MNPVFIMKNEHRIGVTSITFAQNEYLRNELKKHSFAEVRYNTGEYPLSEADLIDFFSGLDGTIIGREKINNAVLSASPQLKAISKFGVGLDNIDFSACMQQKVEVLYSEGTNKRSVAEQALAFMIFLMRNLFKTASRLKRGQWDKDGGRQLTDKVIGIIGVGNIGKEVVHLLKPFNCHMLVNDIIDQKSYYRKNGLVETTKEKIFKEADIITIHTPLTRLTRNMVQKKTFKKMKNSAFLINTARGAIVNQEDLKWALRSGEISGAAIDVFETEPPTDKGLLEIENLICTPHIGGNAREAVEMMGLSAINNLVNYFFPVHP
jgi:D-3-phosphoglycerate dehydrogenase